MRARIVFSHNEIDTDCGPACPQYRGEADWCMLFRGWLHGDRHPECLAALKCSPQVKIDIGQALAADDALHPNGRCTCHGDGRCEWCKGICRTCGGDGRAPQCIDGRSPIPLPKPGAEFEWHGGRCVVKLCKNGVVCFTDPDGRNDRWFSQDDWARNSEWIRPIGAWAEQIAKEKLTAECTNPPEAVEASAQAPEQPEPRADFVKRVEKVLGAFWNANCEPAEFAPEAARMLGMDATIQRIVYRETEALEAELDKAKDERLFARTEMTKLRAERNTARTEAMRLRAERDGQQARANDVERACEIYLEEVVKLKRRIAELEQNCSVCPSRDASQKLNAAITEATRLRVDLEAVRAERDELEEKGDELKARLGKLGSTYAKDGVEWIPWRKSASDLATDIRQALTANELAKLIAELAPDGRVSQAKYDDMLAAHDNLLNSFKERGKKLMAATMELERTRISRDAILKIAQTLRESP